MTPQAQNCDAYPFFGEWAELIVFEVDGVEVKGVATHRYREDRVRLIWPFVVEGDEYLQGFRPPLVILAAAMVARRKSLDERGLTVTDDCRRMCANLYRLHSTKIRISEEIEQAKIEFLTVFQPELDQLERELEAQKRLYRGISREVSINRNTHKKGHFDGEAERRFVQKFAKISETKYLKLKSDVAYELERIERSMIKQALIAPLIQQQPLRLVDFT